MPIYKGSSEVTSGSLRKGSTEVQNGYKETSQFYVNQNSITILFVDSVSGATLNTTQSFQTGTPGTAFTTITRILTADSNRLITAASVSESGDTQGTVSASISSSGSSNRTVTVSGTFPTQSTTVTITVSGTTVQDQPNLIVSGSLWDSNQPNVSVSSENGAAIGNYTWSYSTNCPNGTNASGSGSTSGSSTSVNLVGAYRGTDPACGSSCSSSVSVSASGFDSGSAGGSVTGQTPELIPTCTIQSGFNWNYDFNHNPSAPSSNPDGCSTIKLQTNGISNLSGFGVRAADCAGSWPSSWTDTLTATFSFIRCTGATGTTFGNITCTGGGNAAGLIWPGDASGALFNA
jgi:hypothetical protein